MADQRIDIIEIKSKQYFRNSMTQATTTCERCKADTTSRPHDDPRTSYPAIGTVIHGTMRSQDLLPAWLDVVKTHHPAEYSRIMADIPADAFDNDDHCFWTDEDSGVFECSWILNEDLFDVLNNLAPPWTYFGSHEGDGSDYGFWPSWDAISDAVNDKEILEVGDLSEVPDNYTGEVFIVNDHGNATIGFMREGGKFDECWAVV